MAGKIYCDGCRQQFTYAEMRIHLSIDAYLEKMKGVPPAINNRGNRATTAPVVNFNDPQLSLELCPRRAERIGRAGAMHCDERAPESLPIVLPAPLGRHHLEELKDTLLDAWEARRRQKSTDVTVAALQKEAAEATSLRPRHGRNMLIDDDIRQKNAKKNPELKTAAAAAHSANNAPYSVAPTKPLPDYMKPLRRTARPQSATVAQSRSLAQTTYHDPQEGGNQRPYKGLVVLTAGQVTPVYVRI
jgi:hypothetical protein